MVIDYGQYTAKEILEGDINGKRLITFYVRDYRAVMGSDPCINCGKFTPQLEKFKQKISEMKELKNSGFKLKPMFEGIQTGFGSREFVSNANLDDEKAMKLIENHPKGRELFEELPEGFDPETFKVAKAKEDVPFDWENATEEEVEKHLKTLKKDALIDIAEAGGIEPKGTKDDLILAILTKREENKNPE